MTTIATPTITNQANGSFAENANKTNKNQTVATTYEPIRKATLTHTNKKNT